MSDHYDFIVVGHGAAGLAAAVTYAERAVTAKVPARVAILDRGPREQRGGATRWTGAFMRVDPDGRLDPNWADYMQQVSGGLADDAYCRRLEAEAPTTIEFLRSHGVKLLFDEFPLAHTFDNGVPSVTPPCRPDGGGLAIVEALSTTLESFDNVDFFYNTEALRLLSDDRGRVNGVVVRDLDGMQRVLNAPAVVLACGGFQGNPEMLTRYLGERACDLPLIAPGVAGNRGDGIRMALDLGADTSGQFDMIHAEPMDTRSSAADAVLYSFTTGIFLNAAAERFYDEGNDTWDNTFEKVGYEIWKHQDQKAFWIADAKTLRIPGIEIGWLSDLKPEQTDTLEELAERFGLDPVKVRATVDEFNTAVSDDEFDWRLRDGKHTSGLQVPKSNWAVPLDEPPFIGFPLTGVICFTFGGIRTDVQARVVTPAGTPIPGLYGAGELTGAFYHEYPVATSVLRSLTFGRIAAEEALERATAASTAATSTSSLVTA
jgi:tricarballylate dehydrogenase